MKIRSRWKNYIHSVRQQEIDSIFSKCPKKIFSNMLEVGGGDGFQSTLLKEFTKQLICTDINAERLRMDDSDNTKYIICDAELIGSYFQPKSFDLIFSSNLFEHLVDPKKTIVAGEKLLTDDGIMICIMPSIFWKISQLVFFIPYRLINLFDKLFNRLERDKLVNKYFFKNPLVATDKKYFSVNNPKTLKKIRPCFLSLFLPETHGVSMTHWQEFLAFRKSRWLKEFRDCGMEVVKVKKGPITSGYGFGLLFFSNILKRLGFTSEYIYFVSRKNEISKFIIFF